MSSLVAGGTPYAIGTPSSATLYILDGEAPPAQTGDFLVEAFDDENDNGPWDATEIGVAGLSFAYSRAPWSGELQTLGDGSTSSVLDVGNYNYTLTAPDGYRIPVPFVVNGLFDIKAGQQTAFLLPLSQFNEMTDFVQPTFGFFDATIPAPLETGVNTAVAVSGVSVTLFDGEYTALTGQIFPDQMIAVEVMSEGGTIQVNPASGLEDYNASQTHILLIGRQGVVNATLASLI